MINVFFRQFLTLYPHTDDNTFLGFVVATENVVVEGWPSSSLVLFWMRLCIGFSESVCQGEVAKSATTNSFLFDSWIGDIAFDGTSGCILNLHCDLVWWPLNGPHLIGKLLMIIICLFLIIFNIFGKKTISAGMCSTLPDFSLFNLHLFHCT